MVNLKFRNWYAICLMRVNENAVFSSVEPAKIAVNDVMQTITK